MDLFGIGAEISHPAGDPVIKARTNIDHQITAMHCKVGLIKAMHAQHPQPLVTGSRIGPQTHQG